jgi:hypothetical protein
MYYICIEHGKIICALNYEPNVPESVEICAISNEQHAAISEAKTHYFDIATKSVIAYEQHVLDTTAAIEKQLQDNAKNGSFLNSTDWQVMRHIRELALNMTTTLSNEEYLALERERAAAAAAIINPANPV